MNAVQHYFMNVAITAIRQAAGNMIRDAEVDPESVVKSMQEFVMHIENSGKKLDTNIRLPYKFSGIESRGFSNELKLSKPIFV